MKKNRFDNSTGLTPAQVLARNARLSPAEARVAREATKLGVQLTFTGDRLLLGAAGDKSAGDAYRTVSAAASMEESMRKYHIVGGLDPDAATALSRVSAKTLEKRMSGDDEAEDEDQADVDDGSDGSDDSDDDSDDEPAAPTPPKKPAKKKTAGKCKVRVTITRST